MDVLKNYIHGKLRDSISGNSLEVTDPATGSVYAQAPQSGPEDIDQAVTCAQKAFPAWSEMAPTDRARILRNIAQRIQSASEDFARAECIDTGKPVSLARRVDIPRSVLNLEFFADAITQFSSDCHPAHRALHYTTRKPHGVMACISPWNLPLYLFTWKIAPALAAGNTVVAKPSEVTPMTAFLFSKVCIESELPPGVLNIVHGYGHEAGQALVEHPDIKAISFTGSTRVGSMIAQEASKRFQKVSLEMGGKNPTIVFEDCDLELAAQTAVRAAFSNQGQICLCGSRILIQKSVFDSFRSRLTQLTQELKVGDPLEESTQQGAVVSKAHFEKVNQHLKIAQEEGGQFLTGGGPIKVKGRCENGWFIEPTLIDRLPIECRTNREEIFGPVASIISFETEQDAIEIANATDYGLSASIFTKDVQKAHRVSDALETGMVWINTWMNRDLRTPFGGVKQSGMGREGGLEALRFCTEPKNICVAY